MCPAVSLLSVTPEAVGDLAACRIVAVRSSMVAPWATSSMANPSASSASQSSAASTAASAACCSSSSLACLLLLLLFLQGSERFSVPPGAAQLLG